MLPRLAYVIDPRFPGGTSSALAAEIPIMLKHFRITIHAISSAMFSGQEIAPQLGEVIDEFDLDVIWDSNFIKSDIIVLHNPSFLKFNTGLNSKLITKRLIVVTHENFQRPGGADSFDVDGCLSNIADATLSLEKSLAPISTWNRQTVENWFETSDCVDGWSIYPAEWFNICDFETISPTHNPKDRRGRYSRSGFEKFPPISDLDSCFPAHADNNVILGAETLQDHASDRPHWACYNFREIEIEQFFTMIDFFVYFTAETWRESFGRALAEAIAAGKVVISDPETAQNFGAAVIGAKPHEVDDVISKLIQKPARYAAHVKKAQAELLQFSGARFEQRVITPLVSTGKRAA